MLTKFINSVLEYFMHESTYEGLLLKAFAYLHYTSTPDFTHAVEAFLIAGVGVIKVFIQDRNVDKSAAVQ